MRFTIGTATCIAAGLLFAACSRKEAEIPAAPAAAPAAAAPTVIEAMTSTIIPGSDKIWKMSGDLYDDKGNLDAKKLTDAQWAELKDAAVAMGATARTLAAAMGIKVAPPGGKIQGEGTPAAPTAARVQAAIDADPRGFAEHATQLVALADEIAAAASTHDAKKMDDAQTRMTDVCGACHSKFWYPDQPAP